MMPQVSAGSIADTQGLDEGGIAQSTLLEILHRFRMTVELKPVKCSGLLQHCADPGSGELPLEEGETLAEREMLREFDKTNQVTAAAAAVAVEQILTGIDVEGRTMVVMQGTKPNELLLAGGVGGPVVLPQIVQQRNPLLEALHVLHVWSIKPRRPANQWDVVCKTPPGSEACAWRSAG